MAFYDRHSMENIVKLHRLIRKCLISTYGRVMYICLPTADKRVLCSVQCGSFNTNDTICTAFRRLIVPYNCTIITIMLSGIRGRNDTKKKKHTNNKKSWKRRRQIVLVEHGDFLYIYTYTKETEKRKKNEKRKKEKILLGKPYGWRYSLNDERKWRSGISVTEVSFFLQLFRLNGTMTTPSVWTVKWKIHLTIFGTNDPTNEPIINNVQLRTCRQWVLKTTHFIFSIIDKLYFSLLRGSLYHTYILFYLVGVFLKFLFLHLFARRVYVNCSAKISFF